MWPILVENSVSFKKENESSLDLKDASILSFGLSENEK